MAAVSLSPIPVPFPAAMSSSVPPRRVPLSANLNAANSPLRTGAGSGMAASTAAAAFAKHRRSHASMQREENYGLAPPAKKQMLEKVDNVSVTISTRVSGLRSPTTATSRRVPQVQRASTSRAYQAERASAHQHQQQQQPQHSQQQHHHIQVSEKEAEEVRRWQQSQRLRFPKLVFYFDGLPEDQNARLSKQVMYLGAVSWNRL